MDATQLNTTQNVISGFRKTGVIPLNEEEVLQLLPKLAIRPRQIKTTNITLINLFSSEMRYSEKFVRTTKNKKLNVKPGKKSS